MKDILAFFAVTLFIFFLFFLIGLTGCQWMKGGGAQESVPPEISVPSIPKSINWLATISIIGLAFSVAALVNGYKWGMGGAVGSGIALWAVITVNQYAKWIAILGLLVGILVFIVAVLQNKKVLVDVIKSVERGKEKLNVVKSKLTKELATQKPATQKIVNKIREKLNGEKK